MKNIVRKIVWIIGILVNTVAQFFFGRSYLYVDVIAQIIGRSLGSLFISYLLLLPLAIFKKNELRKKLLPYLFLIISLISIIGGIS